MDNKTKQKLQCPNCKSFKIKSSSKKQILITKSLLFLGIGAILSLIGLSVLGVLIFLIGLFIAIKSLFTTETDDVKCKSCEFEFSKNSINQNKV